MEEPVYSEEVDLDLSKYSIKDCCWWLLGKLNVDKYKGHPYALPFCSYVLTWHKSVPLTCIIIGQSPYPNNVFPPIAAAMSYDTDLCIEQVKLKKFKAPIPPTVEIFANDLYINAGMNKEESINILKNGWTLVDEGILLINERVFTEAKDPEYYKESSNQCNVVIRLLRETEQYGKRTVDVYGLGEAGQRVASNLCSWYKSNTVKLSKHTASHPASLARRFDNFQDSNCHMGTPSFSKSIAKHLSNHVALLHVMGKKTEQDIALQRYADMVRSASEQLKLQQESQTEFTSALKYYINMNGETNSDLSEAMTRLINASETLSFRCGVSSSVMSNIQRAGENVSGHVSKPGPSLTNPSQNSLSIHASSERKTSLSSGIKTVPFNFKKSKVEQAGTENSSFSHVSQPSSVRSVQTSSTLPTQENQTNITPSKEAKSPQNRGMTPVKFNFSKSNKSTSSTPVQTKQNETPSKSSVDNEEEKGSKESSSLSAHFKKMNLTADSKKLENTGKQKMKESQSMYKMTPEERNQLSSVEAVVSSQKPEALEDEYCMEVLESIQHDIKNMNKLNGSVHDLTEAINEDLKNIPKFDFSNWAIDSSTPSKTFDVCKEIFDF